MYKKFKFNSIGIKSVAIIFAALAVSLIALGGRGSAHGGGLRCQDVSVKVPLSQTDPTKYRVSGELCAKGGLHGKTLQFLVPGLTYDRTYWDFPYKSERYSYVRNVTDAGYATLNIDRIGSGKSERPASPDMLTVQSQAYAVSQIVELLRDGKIGHTKFDKIIGAGHSLGGAIWLYEAGEFGNVDGLILQDTMQATNLPFIITIPQMNHPANQDPKFAHLGLPDGYMTSKPGERINLYYNRDTVDPKVVKVDEKTKAIAANTERTSIAEARSEPYVGKKIGSIPILIAIGELDALFCDAQTPGLSCATQEIIKEREQPYFSDQACLDAYVLPAAGHNINLHKNAPEWFDAAVNWADNHVGKKEHMQPPKPC